MSERPRRSTAPMVRVEPGDLFRLMPADAKDRLMGNIVGSLSNAPKQIQELQVQHFYKADPAYGTGVAKGLGLDINAVLANGGKVAVAD